MWTLVAGRSRLTADDWLAGCSSVSERRRRDDESRFQSAVWELSRVVVLVSLVVSSHARPPAIRDARARRRATRAGAMPTSSTFGASALRKGRAGAPSGSTAGTFGRPPPSPRRTAPMRTTPTPGESSARSGPASPYAGVAGAPSRAGAARTPGRISLVERQAQYALPSSASRTRPSGGPGASGTSPVARPAVAARRALAAGSAAPSRTAAAPTPSRGLERGLKTPGEKTPATSSRLAKTAAAASPAGARATSVRAKTKSRNDPAAAEPSPPTSPGAESHLGRPLRLRLDAAADADTAQTPGPAAIAHEIPSAPRSRPAREAPPRGAGEESRSAARSPGPPSPSPGRRPRDAPGGRTPPKRTNPSPSPSPSPFPGFLFAPRPGRSTTRTRSRSASSRRRTLGGRRSVGARARRNARA